MQVFYRLVTGIDGDHGQNYDGRDTVRLLQTLVNLLGLKIICLDE